MVPVTSRYNHLVTSFGLKALGPVYRLMDKLIESGSLVAAGAVLADVWLEDSKMPVVDCLGEEFLSYVKDGMKITVHEDGQVDVD